MSKRATLLPWLVLVACARPLVAQAPTDTATVEPAPFAITAVLASAGALTGAYVGAAAARAADPNGECVLCLPYFALLPLGSALGSWVGASLPGGRPSFLAALGGAGLAFCIAYAADRADGANYVLVPVSYALTQGLVTALSTLR
jgi:hypothetical protein